MSYWTYIDGVIKVSPLGRTQPEKRYILDTVLAHLPCVTGSDGNMKVHVIQCDGYSGSSSHNEFEESMWYRRDADCDGWMRTQRHYMLVVEAHLRDRIFDETLRELNKWLNRLAKRVDIEEILLRLHAYDRELVISDAKPYQKMAEWPSWCEESGGEPAWAEYLMWDSAKDCRYPLKLMYKYYNDPENDAEVERRRAWEKE